MRTADVRPTAPVGTRGVVSYTITHELVFSGGASSEDHLADAIQAADSRRPYDRAEYGKICAPRTTSMQAASSLASVGRMGCRLEDAGAVHAEWGLSENNRRARYYSLSAQGRQMLRVEVASWIRYVATVSQVLGADDATVESPAGITAWRAGRPSARPR